MLYNTPFLHTYNGVTVIQITKKLILCLIIYHYKSYVYHAVYVTVYINATPLTTDNLST